MAISFVDAIGEQIGRSAAPGFACQLSGNFA